VVNHRRKRSKLRKAAMNVKKEKAIATERASNATAKGTRKGRKATARDVKKAGGELKKVAKK
jgi:hypothetical protein